MSQGLQGVTPRVWVPVLPSPADIAVPFSGAQGFVLAVFALLSPDPHFVPWASARLRDGEPKFHFTPQAPSCCSLAEQHKFGFILRAGLQGF